MGLTVFGRRRVLASGALPGVNQEMERRMLEQMRPVLLDRELPKKMT